MILSATLTIASMTLVAQASAKTDLYVAKNGNDAWTGTLAMANQDKTDGPFATLERARDAIAEHRRAGALPDGPITVHIRAGDYDRDTVFDLASGDSGTKVSPIVYRAYKGETVRLLGGVRVTNFQRVTDVAILERLDTTARGEVFQADLKALGVNDFGEVVRAGKRLELFFDNRPMTLARWPNEGFTTIVDVVGGEPFKVHGKDGDKVGKFTYDGDRPSRWKQDTDIWLHGYWFWDWSDGYQKVESIDVDSRTIQLAKPYHGYGYRKGQRFYALNLLSELDSPGEWYLDRSNGMLYFWPPSELSSADAFVSTLDTTIDMKDVSDVTIRGLVMSFNRGTAVVMTGGARNRIAGCVLRNHGGRGVAIREGVGHAVISCDIDHTGDGGISMTGGDRKTLTPCNHVAVNNHIHRYSRNSNTYRTAVSAHGVGCRIAHNLIHDAPHMAMGISGNDHVVECNEIHHVCMDTDDAGAFYMGRDWTWRDNVIRFNYFHHVGDFKSWVGTQAIYLDDWASDTLVYGNIVTNTFRGILVGGGRDNEVRNNIIVDCQHGIHVDSRGLGWAKNYFDGRTTTLTDRLEAMPYRQPPWSLRYPELLTLYDDEPALAKYNILANNILVDCRKPIDLRDGLTDKVVRLADNLIDTDPLFVDAANGDYRLRPDSPAWDLGFVRIPVEKIGLFRDELRPSPAP